MANIIHVVMITPEYPPSSMGGLGTHVNELAQGLANKNIRVTIFVTEAGPSKLQSPENVQVIFCRPPELGVCPFTFERYYRQVDHVTSQVLAYFERDTTRPDLVHCHDWVGFPFAAQIRRLWRIPVVSTIHFLQHPISWKWGVSPSHHVVSVEEEMCTTSNCVLTVSHAMLNEICNTYPAAVDHIRVIYNGFKKPECAAPLDDVVECLRSFNIEPQVAATVLVAARLVPQKGICFLLESARSVLKVCSNLKYLIVGDFNTPYARVLRSWIAAQQDLRPHVCFLGQWPREKLLRLHGLATIAAIPSVYEPFGYAITEAMAAGVPVIVTNSGGAVEIVENGHSGLVVDVLSDDRGFCRVDVEQLANAQIELLTNPAMALAYGQQGAQDVQQRFTVEQMVEETYEAYMDVLKDGSSHFIA